MITGLERVQSRRMWFVPELSVWGLAGWGEVDYVVAEQVGSTVSILYGQSGLGEDAQLVVFAELRDHRGNILPPQIESPLVLVRPRTSENAYVVGQESETAFKIARDSSAARPVMTDLLIIEMGS